MRFSQLIAALQQGEAGLQAHHLGSDPVLVGAASIDKAAADQISFLEKGSALASQLETSAVGAVLLPDQDDLKQLADAIEPILIVGMGGAVGFIVIALFLPIVEIIKQLTG